MSNAQNMAYTVAQTFHNFGAVVTLSGSLALVRNTKEDDSRKLILLTLGGWLTQAVSGSAFAMVSFYFYRKLPDIAGIALIALATKILCVAVGFLIVSLFFLKKTQWGESKIKPVGYSSFFLSTVALIAAAFLRWFS